MCHVCVCVCVRQVEGVSKNNSASLTGGKEDVEMDQKAPIYKGKPPTDEAVPMLPTNSKPADSKPPAPVTNSGDNNSAVTPVVTVTPGDDDTSGQQGAGLKPDA